jgi:pilus assembly protein CpaB
MRRIRPATVTVAVLAILFGLVAAYTARRFMEPAPPAPEKTVPVVVAKVNLPKNGRLREQDVEVVRVPVALAPQGALTTVQRAIYRVVKDTTMSGMPVLESALYPVGEMPTLADQVPPGYRAVTFTIDRNNALAGVLMPQSIVDVAMTVKGAHPELHEVTTLTLLRNVKILATSQNLFKREEKVGQALRSVTVLVTPEDANKLILAQKYGTLSVTLCSPVDSVAGTPNAIEEKNSNDSVNPLSLLGLKPVEPPKPVAQTKAQIWRGTSMTEVTFDAGRVLEEKDKSPAAVANSSEPKPTGPQVVPTSYGREVREFNPYHREPKDNAKSAVPPIGSAAQR